MPFPNTPADRYQHDFAFRDFVDSLEIWLDAYTLDELREAVLMVHVRRAQRCIRPHIIFVDPAGVARIGL